MYCNEHNLQTNDFHVCVIYRFVTCGQVLQNFTQSSHLRYALQIIWCRILLQVCILAQLFSSCYSSHGSNGLVPELVLCCLEGTMQWWALYWYWFFIMGMQASVKATNYTYHKWSNKRPGRLLNFWGPRGAFNRWEAFKRERRLFLVTYFNELNLTVYSMLSAKNVFVLTESRLRADALSRNWTWHNTQTDVNQAMKLINWLILLYFAIS